MMKRGRRPLPPASQEVNEAPTFLVASRDVGMGTYTLASVAVGTAHCLVDDPSGVRRAGR